jgi:choline dehydrogenase
MGFPIIDDMNGPMRPGAGYINMNIGSDGTRASSARTFLRPNLRHSNLTLMLNTHATRILFEGDRARWVELVNDDVTQTIEATREIILAAGTIHGAKLLMLSGVGDAAALKKLGIAPVANLRGVGKNLQDHVLVSGVVYSYEGNVADRPADSNGVEAEVYLSSGVDDNPIDIALILGSFRLRRRTRRPALLRPQRRALRLRLRSLSRRAAGRCGSRTRTGAMHP